MQPLRIAQISDFHFTRTTWNPLKLCSKRLVGQLNWLASRKKSFSEKQIEALAPFLNQLDLDWVLLGGDLTSTSLPSEFQTAQQFVKRLKSPWAALPGNHDAYTLGAYWSHRFYRFFGTAGTLKTMKVEHRTLHPSWTLILLDTAVPGIVSKGLFSQRQEVYLRSLLSSIPKDQHILLFNHYPFFNNDRPSRGLERAEALEQMIAKDPRIKLYLHGHTHRQVIANLQSSGFPIVLDSGCVAHAEQGSWNLLTLNDRGIQVDFHKWMVGQWQVERSERIEWTTR